LSALLSRLLVSAATIVSTENETDADEAFEVVMPSIRQVAFGRGFGSRTEEGDDEGLTFDANEAKELLDLIGGEFGVDARLHNVFLNL